MLRQAIGLIASGVVLFAASAVDVMGDWAAVTAVLVIIAGALALAIVMEDTTEFTPRAVPPRSRATGPDPDAVA